MSGWFFKLILEKIVAEDAFLSLDDHFLVNFFNCIDFYKNELSQALKELNLECATEIYLNFFITSSFYTSELTQFPNRIMCVEHLEFGDSWDSLISIRKFKPRWVEKLSVEELNKDLSSSPKIVRFMQSVGRILRRKKLGDFLELISLFDSKRSVPFINYCLDKFAIESPLKESLNLNENIEYIKKLKPAQFREEIRNGFKIVLKLKDQADSLSAICRVVDAEQWPKFLENMPEVGILMWLKINHQEIDENCEKMFFDRLLKQLIKYPTSLVFFSESWGKMVADFPEHETCLRELFLKAVKQNNFT